MMPKGWGIIALVVVGLYWLQAVLIPLALAVLLTFLLSPVVGTLQRRGLGRVPSVLVTVLLALSILGATGWTLTRQLVTLADELPRYSLNIHQRIADLHGASQGGSMEKVQQAVEDVVGELQKTSKGGVPGPRPLAVVLEPPSILAHLPTLLQALASAGVVTVLMIFMLLERRELRDRVILLIGYRRMTATTRALDEAGERISRYLVMQSLINGSFGVAVGLGLFLIGVPYAVTWGCLAAALRFIPYLGAFVALLLPLALSLAVFPGWLQPALIVGLFFVLELITGWVMEPWLYCQSAGVSPVALLIALTFWTWLWGPVGLLMATPLTVCLLVLGKHLPALRGIVVLMGDRPVIEAKARYYQRLLARDQDEAIDIVETCVNADGRESVYDAVLLPALYYAKQDRDRGLLSESDAHFVGQATREILDVLAHDAPAPSERDTGDLSVSDPGDTPVRILGCPARDEADAVALEMVRHLLDSARYPMEVSKTGMLVAEVLAWVDLHRPALVCIGAVAPGGLSQARHLCKRLRSQYPELKIVVGRWGLHDEKDTDRGHLLAAGADYVETTVLDTQRALAQVALTLGRPAPESPPTPVPEVVPWITPTTVTALEPRGA
ncbi:MAG TPA: AI-2E family transporter [Candidatus Eisenbacteria bacterium]|nr:AI-2E family transporter [Candidatus Eisenbacteria bacterium]